MKNDQQRIQKPPRELMQKYVIILSGGMDSVTLLYTLVRGMGKERVHALTLNYGQRHAKEITCARMNCAHLGVSHLVIDITSIAPLLKGSALTDNLEVPDGNYTDEKMRLTVVPNRNMIFLSLAIAHAVSLGAGEVYYGAHAGDHAIYPDCRPVFIDRMNAAAAVANYKPVRIVTPFSTMDKGDIVKLGTRLDVPYEHTWTCYKGLEKSCGTCGSCTERLEAFTKVGRKDPLEYLPPST